MQFPSRSWGARAAPRRQRVESRSTLRFGGTGNFVKLPMRALTISFAERFRQVADAIAAFATASRTLPAMLPSHGCQGFRTNPIPSGWVQTGERWALWYNGRETASITRMAAPGSVCGWKARSSGT